MLIDGSGKVQGNRPPLRVGAITLPAMRRSFPFIALLAAASIFVASCTAVEGAASAGLNEPADSPTTSAPTIETPTTIPTTTTSSTTTPPSTTSSSTTTTTMAPKGTVVVNGTGDVNLDPTFVRSFPSEGYAYAWSGLDGLFQADDLTIVNLECSASDLGTKWDKAYNFRCDPAALPPAAAAGVDVANLANNHAMDYGMEAMLDARQNLLDAGIVPVGAGANADEAYAPALFEIEGWTVAVLGGGGVHPETGSWIAGDDRPGMTDGDSIPAMVAAIEAADEVADIVIVTTHWGQQGDTSPRREEMGRAEAFIDAGADGVFGHHSHRLNPLDWYKGRPIAWSLGDFVWQAYPASARHTAVAQFVFEPDGDIGACLIPVFIERPGHPVLEEPHTSPCRPEPQPD